MTTHSNSKIDLQNEIEAPRELRELIRWVFGTLGKVVATQAGEPLFQIIESIRARMASLRDLDEVKVYEALQLTMKELQALSSTEKMDAARAYSIMLELMNSCENAYRSHRLILRMKAVNRGEKKAVSESTLEKPDAIIYVLTAHPTEARAPSSIQSFHIVQRILIESLEGTTPRERLENRLFHAINLAWKVPMIRAKAPEVSDEADHIFSTLLNEEILESVLLASREVVPVYIRSWVGGDKDGHPGVDEKMLRKSLTSSRVKLAEYAEKLISQVQDTDSRMPDAPLHKSLTQLIRLVKLTHTISSSDGGVIVKLREEIGRISALYQELVGAVHPKLVLLKQLLHIFPGFVVPLELRESSDVLMKGEREGEVLAIDRMLQAIGEISAGGDPRWYARGFIVSMTSEVVHLKTAANAVRRVFGQVKIPVIPLFEEVDSLNRSTEMVRDLCQDPEFKENVRNHWGGHFEIMVGYSDSSKEGGVFPSRLAIARAMNRLDEICKEEGIKPLFFQGSGGSVDRGGGTVRDQTAWWPHSALKMYKVTIQGEMVERSLSTREIARGQIEKVFSSVSESLSSAIVAPHLPILDEFAREISVAYKSMVKREEFLELIEKATPYRDLSELKMGSRPAKRSVHVSVQGLRAIPWVMCWTQTRILFPTWWGVGNAWKTASAPKRDELKRAFREEPVFSSFVRALGFTLDKVELPVWKLYIERSGMKSELAQSLYSEFKAEYEEAVHFVQAMSGEENLLWFSPWLGESIRLRSPMIHPLNLLQMIAREDRDILLLRWTVTGIASGMLTAG